MKCRGLLLLLALLAAPLLPAQQGEQAMARRHAAIDSLYRAERYAELIPLVEAQIKTAPGTPWADSLYRYVYAFARAQRAEHGAAASVAAGERLVGLVQRLDPSPLHRIAALTDLSWAYYDLGRIDGSQRADSLAMVEALKPGVPPDGLGRTLQNLGFDAMMAGNYETAAGHYRASATAYRSGDTSAFIINLSECHNGLGSAWWHLGRNAEAEVEFRLGLRLLDSDTGLEVLGRKAGLLGNLALLREDAGDLVGSKRYTVRGIAMQSTVIARAGDQGLRDRAVLSRSRGYVNLAALYNNLGDFGTAEHFLDLARKDRLRIMEADDPRLVRLDEQYADLAFARGHFYLADSLLRRTLANQTAHFGPQSESVARESFKLAQVEAAKGDRHSADSLYRQSIALHRKLQDPATSTWLASALHEQAAFELKHHEGGDPYAALEESRAIYRRVYGADNWRSMQVELTLANSNLDEGRSAAAEAWADSLLAKLRPRLPEVKGTALTRAYPAPHLLPSALLLKVRLERRRSGDRSRQMALLRTAVEALTQNRMALHDEDARLRMVAAQKAVFNMAQQVAFEQYRATGNDQWIDTLFRYSEANKALLLRKRLNGFAAMGYAGIPDSLLARENELLQAIGTDIAGTDSEVTLVDRERDFTAFLHDLQRDHPRYYALKYGDAGIGLPQVRKELLVPGRQLLSYSFVDSALCILVAGPGGSHAVLVPATGISDDVHALGRALERLDTAASAALAQRLYASLIAPVAQWLQAEELLIVPDEVLYLLNFELLAPSEQPARMLIRDHVVSYLLSATSAVRFRQLDRHGGTGMLAMAPGFSDKLKADYRAAEKDSSTLDPALLHAIQQPFSVRTAHRLAGTFSAAAFTGEHATERRFRELASRYGIIHLGTHAELNNAAPLYSRLYFSPDTAGSTGDDDGYLYAYEVYGLELKAELAVLSACETGAGDENSPAGVRSIAYGFAYAGCPSLVTSLWRIDEQVSDRILLAFYRYLGKGMPKNKALRQAKLDYLAMAPPEMRGPYYWAGLVLMGDERPVKMAQRPWWPWVLGGLLLLLGGFLLWRKAVR